MKLLTVVFAALLFSGMSYANDGKIVGPVYVLGTTLYDHDGNGGTPDVLYGQILLDENDDTWDEDFDGDTETFGDDCSINIIFASNMVDLSTDGGKAMYNLLISAQGTTDRVAVIEYNEDGEGNCIVQSVLIAPAVLFE